jgi:signal peptidase II
MWRWSWIAIVVVVLDQASKFWVVKELPGAPVRVLPVLNFVLTYNKGSAFGFLDHAGGWQNLMFMAIAVVVSVAIVLMIRSLGPRELQTRIGLWMILGGAVGNLLDRIRVGHVIDFIQFHIGDWSFWVFNLADSAITAGAILLALDVVGWSLLRPRSGGTNKHAH